MKTTCNIDHCTDPPKVTFVAPSHNRADHYCLRHFGELVEFVMTDPEISDIVKENLMRMLKASGNIGIA